MPNIFPPGLAGFIQAQQLGDQSSANNLGMAGALMKMQAQQQGLQQQNQFRNEILSLGPNPSQDALMSVAAKYSAPKDILTSQTASLDRKATLDALNMNRSAQREQALELARQRSQDQSLSRAEQNQARMEMIRLTASLRPPPPISAVTIQDPNDPTKNIVIDSRTRQVIGNSPKERVGDKPMTEVQGKSAMYGTRAAQSDKILQGLEDKISLTGLASARALGAAGNFLMSSDQQRVDQAQRDFVNAILRQESGAAISSSEFTNAQKQYFPQPGDTPQTIAQKRANRKIAIQGFARMAGTGGKDINDILNAPLMPSGTNHGEVLKAADAILGGK